jgi:hypothetical protein
VTGLSMFLYGPILCFCVISALGCSVVYNISRYAWEATGTAWKFARRVLFSLLARPTSNDGMGGMSGGERGGRESMWSPFAWLQGGEDKFERDEGVVGWGSLEVPSKEPDWGTQPLEQKFETRQALPGAGGGSGRNIYLPAGTGIGGGGSPLTGSVAGHGRRKGNVYPNVGVVPPFHAH